MQTEQKFLASGHPTLACDGGCHELPCQVIAALCGKLTSRASGVYLPPFKVITSMQGRIRSKICPQWVHLTTLLGCHYWLWSAGFYTVSNFLKHTDVTAELDMFDRLPTPFGLVRAGVAPDHQKYKTVTRATTKVRVRITTASMDT